MMTLDRHSRPIICRVVIDGRVWIGRGTMVDGATPAVVLSLTPTAARPPIDRQADDAVLVQEVADAV